MKDEKKANTLLIGGCALLFIVMIGAYFVGDEHCFMNKRNQSASCNQQVYDYHQGQIDSRNSKMINRLTGKPYGK